MRPLFLACILLLAASVGDLASAPIELQVDFGRTNGMLRPLHGINKGPLAPGGLIDVTAPLRQLGIPSARLHDCHWPNPDVVDIHTVFPNLDADPAQAASYDFAATDEYVNATRQTGAQIVYRLGESIEHTTRKRFVHPPKDPAQWAAVCLGIIRHYNEGWARGAHHDIRYWEIWNEPENRPAMWSGTDDDYFALYRSSATAIKKRFPLLKVGGPAVGASGQLVNGEFRPTSFVTRFLDLCRRESLPLDFFSWHCYTADPAELSIRARALRRLLDTHGFASTESHLNEWNFLPGNTWGPLSRSSPPERRQAFYERMAGASGAAFITTALLELQEALVDVGNLFHGELGGFGLFNEHGVPQKNYYALRAFRALLDTPRRVSSRGAVPGQLAMAAGVSIDNMQASILVSNFSHPQGDYRVAITNLPWSGGTRVAVRRVDSSHEFSLASKVTNDVPGAVIQLQLTSPAVAWIQLQPAGP